MGAGGSAARNINTTIKTDGTNVLDKTMGEDRPAIAYGDEEARGKFITIQAANIRENLEAIADGSATADRQKALASERSKAPLNRGGLTSPRPAEDAIGKTPSKKVKERKKSILDAGKDVVNSLWREKVKEAKMKVAWTITILQAFNNGGALASSQFLENMPFVLADAMGAHLKPFTLKYNALHDKMKERPSDVAILTQTNENIKEAATDATKGLDLKPKPQLRSPNCHQKTRYLEGISQRKEERLKKCQEEVLKKEKKAEAKKKGKGKGKKKGAAAVAVAKDGLVGPAAAAEDTISPPGPSDSPRLPEAEESAKTGKELDTMFKSIDQSLMSSGGDEIVRRKSMKGPPVPGSPRRSIELRGPGSPLAPAANSLPVEQKSPGGSSYDTVRRLSMSINASQELEELRKGMAKGNAEGGKTEDDEEGKEEGEGDAEGEESGEGEEEAGEEAEGEAELVASDGILLYKGLDENGMYIMKTEAELQHERDQLEFDKHLQDEARMLEVHLHNANCRELDKEEWVETQTTSVDKWIQRSAGEAKHYRDAVVTYFRMGQVAVQILAAGSSITLPNGVKTALWKADPYVVAALALGKHDADQIMQHKTSASAMKEETASIIDNLPLGPRHLIAVVMAVEQLAGGGALGKKAVAELKVIIHVEPETEEFVVSDLKQRGYYGINPTNIFIVVQPVLPGWMFDREKKMFVEDGDSPGRVYGTGYAMQQLNFPAEAYVLAAEDGTPGKRFLESSVLSHLVDECKVEWLLSNRLNDMLRLQPDIAVDVDVLARTIKLQEEHGCGVTVEVEQVSKAVMHQVFRQGGVVMARKEDAEAKGGAVFCNEIMSDCLRTPEMVHKLDALMKDQENSLYTSADRYCFHMPALKRVLEQYRFMPVVRLEEWEEATTSAAAAGGEEKEEEKKINKLIHQEMNGNGAASPRSESSRGAGKLPQDQDSGGEPRRHKVGFGASIACYPFYDMADLTCSARMRCCAVTNTFHAPALELKSRDDVERMLDVIYGQDSDPRFAKLVAELHLGKERPVIRSVGASVRYRVMICCSADKNNASLQAAQFIMSFLRPSVDKVSLVHVVQDSGKLPAAQRLLMLFEPPEKSSLIVEKDIRTKPPDVSLPDFICKIAHEKQATLVVMGSEAMSPLNKMGGVGSVAKAVLRKINTKSVLIHKAGGQFSDPNKASWGMRTKWLLGITPFTGTLVKFAGKLLGQDDLVVLGRVAKNSSREETSSSHRLLTSFEDMAYSKGLRVNPKMVVNKNNTQALVQMAKDENTDCLACQVPPGEDRISPGVFEMVQNASCPVLIFRDEYKQRTRTL